MSYVMYKFMHSVLRESGIQSCVQSTLHLTYVTLITKGL